MFTLRVIEKIKRDKVFDEIVENYELGSAYSIITKGKTKEFDEILKDDLNDLPPDEAEGTVESVQSIVCGENGAHWFIQHNTPEREYDYFIMTESGKTFERL